MCTWWIKWILYNVQIGKLSSKSRPAAYGRSGWKSVIDHFPDPSGHLWPAAMANHECLKGWFEVNHLEINCFQYHHILPYIITMYYHMFNITIYYHRHKYMSDSVRFSRRNRLTLRTLRVCHHPLRHMVSLRIMILGSFPRIGRQNLPGLWYSLINSDHIPSGLRDWPLVVGTFLIVHFNFKPPENPMQWISNRLS